MTGSAQETCPSCRGQSRRRGRSDRPRRIMVSLSKVGVVAVGAAAAGVLVLGGAALADAATKASSGTTANGYGRAGGGGYGRADGGSADTPVTGAEATKVGDAV